MDVSEHLLNAKFGGKDNIIVPRCLNGAWCRVVVSFGAKTHWRDICNNGVWESHEL